MPIIPPIALPTLPSVNPAGASAGSAATRALDDAANAQNSSSFGQAIDNALTELSDKEMHADQLARDAATGKLANIEDYMLAATDAQLSMELTVAVRDKAVQAFNDIMRMQV